MDGWGQALAGLASGRGAAFKGHAFLLCGNDARAGDLVQEALVRAFARPLRVPRPGAAGAYVRAIMVNLFVDGARRRSRWSRVAPLLRPAGMAPDPADQVSGHDAVLTALRGLSPRQRACVVLRCYEDLPVAEVAAVVGVGEGTVKRYLSEAMTVVGGGNDLAGKATDAVYLVLMKGGFALRDSGPVQPSCAHAGPAGRYFSAVVDATTFVTLEAGLGNRPPPVPLQTLGPVLNLG